MDFYLKKKKKQEVIVQITTYNIGHASLYYNGVEFAQ